MRMLVDQARRSSALKRRGLEFSVTTGWHPGIKRDLLLGVSARSLASVESWSLGVCFGSLGVAVPLWLLHYDLWTLPFYAISAIALLVSRFVDPMERSRAHKEATAGYTTLRSGANDVDLVDDRSRQLIRFAHEVVSEDELRLRLRMVRGEMNRPIE
jgi:hypothetical protein